MIKDDVILLLIQDRGHSPLLPLIVENKNGPNPHPHPYPELSTTFINITGNVKIDRILISSICNSTYFIEKFSTCRIFHYQIDILFILTMSLEFNYMLMFKFAMN